MKEVSPTSKQVSITWSTGEDLYADLQVNYATYLRIEQALSEYTDRVLIIWQDRRCVRLQSIMRSSRTIMTEAGEVKQLRFKNSVGMSRADLETLVGRLAESFRWRVVTATPVVRERLSLPIAPQRAEHASVAITEPTRPVQRPQSAPPKVKPGRTRRVGKPHQVVVSRIEEQQWLSLDVTSARTVRQEEARVVEVELAEIDSGLQVTRSPGGALRIEARDRGSRQNAGPLNAALKELAGRLNWTISEGRTQRWT